MIVVRREAVRLCALGFALLLAPLNIAAPHLHVGHEELRNPMAHWLSSTLVNGLQRQTCNLFVMLLPSVDRLILFVVDFRESSVPHKDSRNPTRAPAAGFRRHRD
jgi:hypothetical protein